jgi:glyoxylase-like metal-dependent hydrolase (beta-lactamase superfamily II)
MMRSVRLGYRAAVLVALLHAVGTNEIAAAPAPMVVAGKTQKIADNVYVIPDGRVNLVPNVGIIVGDKGVMVIDTGMGPRNAKTVLGEVRKITDKKIRYLAITHFHPEHGMGAQAFPDSARIIVPAAQKQELADKGAGIIKMFSGFSPEIAALLEPVKLVTPDITFEREAEVDLGGMTVRLMHYTRTHTRGDMYVYLPAQRILFGGDVVVNRFFPIMPDADASGLGWLETLGKLKALNPAIVVPGHGEVGDATLISAMEEYLLRMKEAVASRKKKRKSLAQTQDKLVPEFEQTYASWNNPEWIKNAIERFYAEL